MGNGGTDCDARVPIPNYLFPIPVLPNRFPVPGSRFPTSYSRAIHPANN
jgi:hypothetical protein